jgi:hypothetical protein
MPWRISTDSESAWLTPFEHAQDAVEGPLPEHLHCPGCIESIRAIERRATELWKLSAYYRMTLGARP